MLHGDSDPNPYNHQKKRQKILEKNSFNLKGLSIVADYAKNRLFIDQIEFIDASMNQCDLEKDSFDLKITYNHGKMDIHVDGTYCKSMS